MNKWLDFYYNMIIFGLASDSTVHLSIMWTCITTCRRLVNNGGLYKRCRRTQEKRYGTMGCSIKRLLRWCYYMVARVGWWQERCWKCWSVSIIRCSGGLQEWRLGVWRMEIKSTPWWLMRWRPRGSCQERRTFKYGSPPLLIKWHDVQSIRCALRWNGCRILVG